MSTQDDLLKETIQLLLEQPGGLDSLYGSWHPWTPAAKKIPFRHEAKNMGPGEDRLAFQLNLEKQAAGADVDMADPVTGRFWEVKGLSKSDTRFRPNKAGRQHAIRFIQDAATASQQIKELFGNMDVHSQKIIDEVGLDAKAIKTFVNEDIPKIEDGELGKKRFRDLHQIIVALSTFLGSDKAEESEGISVVLRHAGKGINVKRDITLAKFIKIAELMEIPGEEITLSVIELVGSRLHHPFFLNPDAMLKRWLKLAVPTEIFSKLDGGLVFTEDTRGFFVVPMSKLNSHVAFDAITKSELKMRFFATGVPKK